MEKYWTVHNSSPNGRSTFLDKVFLCEIGSEIPPPKKKIHEILKICQKRHFRWLGHKIPNWIKPQTYLQPKFQAPRSKIDLDRKIYVSLILYEMYLKIREI